MYLFKEAHLPIQKKKTVLLVMTVHIYSPGVRKFCQYMFCKCFSWSLALCFSKHHLLKCKLYFDGQFISFFFQDL